MNLASSDSSTPLRRACPRWPIPDFDHALHQLGRSKGREHHDAQARLNEFPDQVDIHTGLTLGTDLDHSKNSRAAAPLNTDSSPTPFRNSSVLKSWGLWSSAITTKPGYSG